MLRPGIAQETQSISMEVHDGELTEPVTVLVVDDHALIRSAISQILTASSRIKQVITVQNYAEAEEEAIRQLPDIIWLDMHIAHSDSIAEISRLRKFSPHSRILALADVEDEHEEIGRAHV